MDSKEIWREFARRHVETGQIQSSEYVASLGNFLIDYPRGLIVSYSAMPGEVDLSGLETKFGADRLCLTRTPEIGHELTVHLSRKAPTEQHRLGFSQPTADAELVSDSDIAVVLVPGLLFDQHGTRLGRGLGYYDRFLARLQSGVIRVGITCDLVVGEALPAECHDIPMTHLASSDGVGPVLDTSE